MSQVDAGRWARPSNASRCRHSLTEKVFHQLSQIKDCASSPGVFAAPPKSQVQDSTLTPYPSSSLSPSLSHHDSDPTGSASTSSSGTAGTTELSGPPTTTRRRSTPGPGPQKLDTELARKGSNFGLPIALQLTQIMNGAVGIVSVSHTVTS